VIKISVLYTAAPKDPEAFDKHYLGVHIPMCQKLPGIKRVEVTKYSGTMDGKPAPYYIQTDLTFDSQDAAMAAFGSDVGKEVVADVANLQGTPTTTAVGSIVA
jgi:uncharacterized protein (TIGR02118 family)